MVERENSATNPVDYDDPIDFSDVIATKKGRSAKKTKKVKLIPAEHVVEYKSKSDQFYDYTSLIGFRLLNSKLPTRIRIAAACIMVTGVILLAYTASGAVGKFFASDTAKLCQFFLLNDKNDDDDDGVTWEVLPEIRFCHGSQFAQAAHRPTQWNAIVDDVRLLLHLHYTNSSSNLGGPSMLPLTDANGPFKNFYNVEMPEISGQECRKWYFEGQYGCNTTLRGRNYCSLFSTISPSNLALQLIPDTSYANFTDFLREKGPCFKSWLERQKTDENDFFCCRLRLAYKMLASYRTMDFTEFLDQIAITKEDHVVVSADELYKSERVWTSQYGQCLSYKTRLKDDIDKNSMKSVTFVLRTSTYDQVGVDGLFAMLVVDDVDANYISAFPGTMTTYYVKERISITDYSCTDGYPRICNDVDGYSIQTCRACYAVRTYCECYSPLQRGLRKKDVRDCTPIEAVQCAVNTTNINIPVSICPFACVGSTYTLVSTVMKIDKAPHFAQTYEKILIDEQERAEVVRIMNRLILAIDNTTIAFPGRSHILWSAVEFLTPLMDEYFNFIRDLVVLAYGDDNILFKINYNTTGAIAFFTNTELSSGSTAVDTALETFWQSTHTGAILTSVWNNESLENPLTVLARSFEATILLTKPANPPAIVNFYKNDTNMNSFITRLEQLCRALPRGTQYELNDVQRKALFDIFLSKSPLFTTSDSCNIRAENEFIKKLQKYLKQYSRMSVQPEDFRQNYVVLTFDFLGSDYTVVEYNLDYTFWYFLTDVGGMMGLFFGMTLVTLYEIVAFCFIDREPPERHARKAVKLTRRTLYQIKPNGEEPLPMIVY